MTMSSAATGLRRLGVKFAMRCAIVAAAFVFVAGAKADSQSPRVVLENNQPFAIKMPVTLRNASPRGGNWISDNCEFAQSSGSNLVFIANVPAGTRREIAFKPTATATQTNWTLIPTDDGISLNCNGIALGTLQWDIFLKPAKTPANDGDTTRENFAAVFNPMPLAFKKIADGPVFAIWSAEAVKHGLKLKLELSAYRDGFLDLNAALTNESADERKKFYAAVICRWTQPKTFLRTLCYDNRISPLNANDFSPFRSGEGRHQFTQRGVDWVNCKFANASVAWLNDFAPSFTRLDESSKNSFKQPRYQGANLPQLGQEIQTAGAEFLSITEIARPNIKSYRDRLAESALPSRGEGCTFSSRLVFNKTPLKDSAVDQMFVGFTSYNEQRVTNGVAEISFGVKSVRFGTSYFPYSTLGENFDTLKLPGMDREAFWPLAADTVLRWREFADDIRRDLRIAKAMGFQLIRLHHLELLASIPKEVRTEYLDFIFNELRHLKLKALLDVLASDDAMVDLLRRYGDVIDTIEIENEILIWGIPLDRPPQWKATCEAVKRAAPHVRVHLTGYNNTGMFNRLQSLGVPFDRVGLHSYVDSLDAIPTARGYALALGSFCSKIGKPPVITEWNWRQLTRMTPEARAKIYPAIFDNALATRAIPEMYQFQFNETLAPNPRIGRGNILRHYELIHLSRRPKLEAFELMKLIQKYSAPDDALRKLDVPHVVAQLNRRGEGKAVITPRNTSEKPMKIRVGIEAPEGFSAMGKIPNEFNLKPGEKKSFTLTLKTRDATPGFYHAFLRLESNDGQLRYGWIEARLLGAPKLDAETKSEVEYPRGVAEELNLDFTKSFAVVYGTNASVLEVETAFAIASTLESATGQPIEIIQSDDFQKLARKPANLILVGTKESNELIGKVALQLPVTKSVIARSDTRLIVSGPDSLAVERAGMDLLLRWWRNAKDSAARRVGLVEKELPRGGDATKLP